MLNEVVAQYCRGRELVCHNAGKKCLAAFKGKWEEESLRVLKGGRIRPCKRTVVDIRLGGEVSWLHNFWKTLFRSKVTWLPGS